MVALSPLDHERFGIVTARCPATTAENLTEVLEFCRHHDVELLIARCDAADFSAVHALENSGARLMDTLVYWARSIEGGVPALADGPATVRSGKAQDASAVRVTAALAFRGYLGHYHTDPRLDRERADEAYADWAYRSCLSRDVADEILVAERSGTIEGFLTIRLKAREAEIVLNGVSPAAQGTGVYRQLLIASMHRARELGASEIIVSTQLSNHRVQHAWARAGFHLASAHYTFHLWRARE